MACKILECNFCFGTLTAQLWVNMQCAGLTILCISAMLKWYKMILCGTIHLLNLYADHVAVGHHRGYATKHIWSSQKCTVTFPELQFVSQTDNIQSCRFVQTMEQRLQRAFQDAERKVWNTSNNLTVQVQHCPLCQCLLLKFLGYYLLCVYLYFNRIYFNLMSLSVSVAVSLCLPLKWDSFVYQK